MTYRIAVCYGHPDDPAAFDDHYRPTRIPLAREVPGLSAYTWGKCAPIGGSPTPYYVVANLYFPTEEAMQQGLGSEQMRKAGKDLCNFATGDVTMFAQFEGSALDEK